MKHIKQPSEPSEGYLRHLALNTCSFEVFPPSWCTLALAPHCPARNLGIRGDPAAPK
jgi:hypothetical protein